MVAERIESDFSCSRLFDSVLRLFDRYPAVQRSPALGGWALQSSNGSYQDGWSLEFCPYNGPGNRSPSWNPKSDTERRLVSVQDYCKPTEITTDLFSLVLARLNEQGLHPRKARIIRLSPGSSSVWHQDGSKNFYQVRLHIPLVTNPDCFFENESGRLHMRADGGFYLVHINRPHRVVNGGATARFHFVAHVWDQKGISQFHRYDPAENQGETLVPRTVES